MALSDAALRRARSAEKPYRISDGDGLYVIVRPTGAKWWRFDYRLNGVRKTMSMGTYPDVSLINARRRKDDARQKVANGIDPVEASRLKKIEKDAIRENTFGKVAAEYLNNLGKLGRAKITIKKNERLLNDLASKLHNKPIREVKAADILPLIKQAEAEGKRETAHRLRGTIGSVFRFAVSQLYTEYDPTFALKGSLLPVNPTHFAAVTDEKAFGGLLRAIDEFEGWKTLRAALQIMALCYPRPIELRKAEWKHFDFEGNVWMVPAHLTKMRRPHDIPLSRQAREIILALRPITGNGEYVFPALRTRRKVISENGMNSALRRMGYEKEEHCSHGFRASASSILNSRKFHPDVIERSLSHIEPNKIRRAYNRYEYWDERVKMAQAWADICDDLKSRKCRNNDDLV